jgi:pyruvate/2-oxoglutarate dehydrogenase complex dihydrolipoamide dehydrogenase (E3) component
MKVAIVERKLFGGTCVIGAHRLKPWWQVPTRPILARRAADFGVVLNGQVEWT